MSQLRSRLLRQFNHLKDGAYIISFSTHSFQADSAHSICYFKQGEKGYLFDPNLGLIECKENAHPEDLLQILSIYPVPSGKTSHNLEVLSVTKKRGCSLILSTS